MQAVERKDGSEVPGLGLFDIGDLLLYGIKFLIQLSRLGDILKRFTHHCKIVPEPPFHTLGYDHLAKEVCYILDSPSSGWHRREFVRPAIGFDLINKYVCPVPADNEF